MYNYDIIFFNISLIPLESFINFSPILVKMILEGRLRLYGCIKNNYYANAFMLPTLFDLIVINQLACNSNLPIFSSLCFSNILRSNMFSISKIHFHSLTRLWVNGWRTPMTRLCEKRVIKEEDIILRDYETYICQWERNIISLFPWYQFTSYIQLR